MAGKALGGRPANDPALAVTRIRGEVLVLSLKRLIVVCLTAALCVAARCTSGTRGRAVAAATDASLGAVRQRLLAAA